MPNFLTDPNIQSMEVTKFSGPNQITDGVDGPICVEATNVEFEADQVKTRRGFAEAFDPNEAIRAMFNWVQTQYNRLVRLNSDTSVVSRDLVADTEVELISSISGAQGMSRAEAGYRFFMSFFKARSGSPGMVQAATYGRVWDGTTNGGSPVIDPLFPAPLAETTNFTVNITEPAGGVITAGAHNFALLMTTWNGASPPPSSQFSFTSAGAKNLSIALTPVTAWPDYLISVQLIMTTVANPDRWYIVPGLNSVASRGSALPLTFVISFDDTTLGQYEEIINGSENDYFSVVYQGGSGYPTPSHILAYGTRMCYIHESLGPDGVSTVSYIAISEPGRYQFVTLAQHIRALPEFKTMVTGFVLGDVLYICGPTYTYAFADNGQAPVLWSEPRLISGVIGSPFVHGVTTNPAHGYGWVADRAGLFWFPGNAFPDLPASYYQTPDWHRINWLGNVDSLQILEDPTNRLVMVKAALDAATAASHWLVWDYTYGFSPDKIRYCGLWSIDSFSPGGAAMVLNPDTGEVEFWSARTTAGNVLRQRIRAEESTPEDNYDDDGAGISSNYRIGPFPGIPSVIQRHIGVDSRVRGNGSLQLTAYDHDQANAVPMVPIDLSAAPSRRWFRAVSKESEGAILDVATDGSAGSYFILSALRWLWRPFGVRF